jgi:hypothetical protein
MRAKKLTNLQELEALAINPLPYPFDLKLSAILAIVAEMRAEAAKIGIKRKFTPDGRFLGDIGEVIVKIRFGVNLHPVQAEGEDGTCQVSGKRVEVKLRSKSTLVWVKKIPDLLIAIYLSPVTLKWGVVCNGPGHDLLQTAKRDAPYKRFVTDLTKLRRAQHNLPFGHARLLESL